MNRLTVVSATLLFGVALGGCKGNASKTAAGEGQGRFEESFDVGIFPPTQGTITSTDGRIDCGPGRTKCGDAQHQTRYEWSVANVTLNAAPAPGFKFVGWAGDCTGKGSCILTRGADRYVVAAFEPAAVFRGTYFQVEVARPTGGVVTSVGSAYIDCGPQGSAQTRCGPTVIPWTSSVTLRASPRPGYVFQGWTDDCEGAGVGECVLDTSAHETDKTVGAVFAATESYRITIARDGTGAGAISADVPGQPLQTCAASQPTCAFQVPITEPPTTIVLSADADDGSDFLRWGGACAGPGVCVLEVGAPKSATATFSREVVGGTVVTSTGGEVTSSAGVTISVPPAALDAPIAIAVSVASDPIPLPEGVTPISPIYSFEPSGQVFSTPITVRLPVPEGTTNACIWWENHLAAVYECIGGTLTPDGRFIETQVTHFCDAYVAAAPGTRTIQGTRMNSHLAARSGISSSPDGLEHETIAAWVPNGNGGFSRIEGHGHADGTFAIPDVPEGEAIIQVSQSLTGIDHFIATDGSAVDFGEISDGLPGLTPVPTGAPMALNLELLDLDGGGGELELISPEANNFATVTLSQGTTALSFTNLPFTPGIVRPVHVIDGARALIHAQQLTPAISAGGVAYLRFSRSWGIRGISVGPNHPPASVSGSLVARELTNSMKFDWDVSKFSSELQYLVPNRTCSPEATMSVVGQPGPLNYGMKPLGRKRTYLRSTIVSPVETISTGEMSFAPHNPYAEETWGVYWSAALTCKRIIAGPASGMSIWMNSTVTAYGPYDGPAGSVSLGAPVLTPPLNIRIDGLPLSTPQTAVSPTPVVAWDPPAVGTPDVYTIRVTRFFTGQSRRDEVVAHLSTKATQFAVPPGVFEPGHSYAFSVTASKDGVSLERPSRAGLPMVEATQQTAWFTVGSAGEERRVSPTLSYATPSNVSAPADGATPILLKVYVYDEAGQPMAGQQVEHPGVPSGVSVTPAYAVTDANGHALFQLTSTMPLTEGSFKATVNPGPSEVILYSLLTYEFTAPPSAPIRQLAGTHSSVTTVFGGGGEWSDPVTGKYYRIIGNTDTMVMEYSRLSDLVNDTNNYREITLPATYAGTYHAALNGNLYFTARYTGEIHKISTTTGATLATATIPNARHDGNGGGFAWAGFTDIALHMDAGNQLYVTYQLIGESVMKLSRLDPDTLAIGQTWTFPLGKPSYSWGFIANGRFYVGGPLYSNATFAGYLTLATGEYTPFTNALSSHTSTTNYITHVFWNPSTGTLFNQNRSELFVYEDVF